MEVGESSGSKESEAKLEELSATLALIMDTTPPMEFWPEHAAIGDCLDFLGVHFGFKKDNVRSQREHVVFLKANSRSRFSTPSRFELDFDVGECSGSKEPEAELEELSAALALIVDTTPPIEFWTEHAAIGDCLDFLGVHFGFKKDNVRDQREHVVFLQANSHSRFSTPSRFELDFDG